MLHAMKSLLAALLAALALLLAGCSTGVLEAPTSADTSLGQPASAPTPEFARDLDAAAFAELIAQPGVVILDVRTPEEFADGHLEGTVNIDALTTDFQAQLDKLDRDVVYAVYCRSGNRSDAALHQMAELGFTSAHHLAGGIGAWQQAGYPVVS